MPTVVTVDRMQLRCQSCGYELHAADVDFDELDATCRHCGWRFGAPTAPYRSAPVEVAPRVAAAVRQPLSQRLPWPAGVSVEHDERLGRIRLSVHLRPVGPLVHAALFLTFAFFVVAVGLIVDRGASEPLLLLVVVSLSLLGAYASAALARNHLVVSADADGIRVEPKPLPWFGARVIPRFALEQLWVAVRESSEAGSRRTYYELRARTARGDVELITEIDSAQAALYLEKVMEDHLGVEDARVLGQYRPLRRRRRAPAAEPDDSDPS
jgi:hypothetical protein